MEIDQDLNYKQDIVYQGKNAILFAKPLQEDVILDVLDNIMEIAPVMVQAGFSLNVLTTEIESLLINTCRTVADNKHYTEEQYLRNRQQVKDFIFKLKEKYIFIITAEKIYNFNEITSSSAMKRAFGNAFFFICMQRWYPEVLHAFCDTTASQEEKLTPRELLFTSLDATRTQEGLETLSTSNENFTEKTIV